MVEWLIMKAMGYIVFALAMLAAGPAAADEKDQAKEHYLKGKALVEEGAYKKAIVELQASYDLNPVPIVLYNIAVAFDSLEQYADATRYYEKYLLEEENLPKDQKKKVLQRIETLRSYLGILNLTVDEEGVEVLVDDRVVGTTPLDAVLVETGNHTLTLRKQGFIEIKKSFTVVSEKTLNLEIFMDEVGAQETGTGAKTEAAGGAAKGRKKLGPAAFAATMSLTAAAGVCAIALGVTAVKKDEEIRGMYENEPWEEVRDERDRLSAAADAMIAVAAAAAVATIVLGVFTDFRKEKKPAAFVAPAFSGKGAAAGLSLSF